MVPVRKEEMGDREGVIPGKREGRTGAGRGRAAWGPPGAGAAPGAEPAPPLATAVDVWCLGLMLRKESKPEAITNSGRNKGRPRKEKWLWYIG